MSVHGKFLVEFSCGDWDLSYTLSTYTVGGSASTWQDVFTTAVTTGDSTKDLLSLLALLSNRMSTDINAYYNGYTSSASHVQAEGDLFPTALAIAYTTASGSTTTLSHDVSTCGLGAAGWVDWNSSDGEDFNVYFTGINWSSCTTTLLDILGFAQTETPVVAKSSTVDWTHQIFAVNMCRYCWFPGYETYNRGGAGITSDTGWRPVDAHKRVVAGSGKMRATGPARLQYIRTLRFEQLKRAEVLESRHNGPIAFFDMWAKSTFRWYPDRDVGTTTTAGTQGDPGPSSYHTDDDCDYWRCKLAKPVLITQSRHPDWFTVTITLNGEPA